MRQKTGNPLFLLVKMKFVGRITQTNSDTQRFHRQMPTKIIYTTIISVIQRDSSDECERTFDSLHKGRNVAMIPVNQRENVSKALRPAYIHIH